jgi:hypothetical protein
MTNPAGMKEIVLVIDCLAKSGLLVKQSIYGSHPSVISGEFRVLTASSALRAVPEGVPTP